MVRDIEVYTEMPRKWSKSVPEGNGPVCHDKVGSDSPTMADLYRMVKERFDKSDRKLDDLIEKTRETNRRLAGLVHRAQQPRLATEADVKSDTKTRKRTEDVAADRMISGDNSSAQVDPDPICLTRFGGDSTGPTALPCSRDDALVGKGAAAPKLCLSPTEMRMLTAAGGLLPPAQPLQR